MVGELNHHLRAEKEIELDGPTSESLLGGNSRNGYSKKTIQTDQGEMDLAIPRDRKSKFEPILVPKHQRRLAGLDEKILVLYARGLSTRDISAQLEELAMELTNKKLEGSLVPFCYPTSRALQLLTI